MPSGMTSQQKLDVVLQSLLPMLKNDLRKVLDCTCAQHGVPGPGPNFTAAMLCMVACEVIGRLSSDTALDDDTATLAFLKAVAGQSGDDRYSEAAKAIVAYFRHGIIHSFMPKQPDNVKAGVNWAQVSGGKDVGACVDWLSSPSGADALASFRSRHLSVRQVGGEKVFTLVPQVFYVDLTGTIGAWERLLAQRNAAAIANLERGFERWWRRLSSIKNQLDDAARNYLGMA